MVVCKENYDGTISELSEYDKEICKLKGFKIFNQ